jgi:hypothetical protein
VLQLAQPRVPVAAVAAAVHLEHVVYHLVLAAVALVFWAKVQMALLDLTAAVVLPAAVVLVGQTEVAQREELMVAALAPTPVLAAQYVLFGRAQPVPSHLQIQEMYKCLFKLKTANPLITQLLRKTSVNCF